MATFNMQEYEKQQSQKQANSGNGGERKPVHFMNEFLGKDGDQVVVRFPYTGVQDLLFESVHKVIGVFPGDKFGKSVRCTGEKDCPLCNHSDDAVKKRKNMFYAKMVVYKPTATGADLCATVWERPAAFADSDLKNLMLEYGDLSNYLFKITRTGKGTDTRYNIIPVNMQSPIYSKEVYTTKDLSCLDGIDATKILSKSVDQYNEVVNPSAAKATETAQTNQMETLKVEESVGQTVESWQKPQETVAPEVQQPTQQYANPQYTAPQTVETPQTPQAPAQQPTTPTQTTSGNVTRYRF